MAQQVEERPGATPAESEVGTPASSAGKVGISLLCAVVVAASVWVIAQDGVRLYLQRCFDGVSNGLLYGVGALSLVVVFKASKVINFSQGSMAMLGCYLAWTLLDRWELPLIVAILAAVVVSASGGALIERSLIRHFDPDNHLAIIMVTLGMFLILNALAALIWGFTPKSFPSLFPQGAGDAVEIFGARLSYQTIGIAAIVLVTVVALELVLNRTRLGLAFRCVANSVERSRILGIHIGRTMQFAWALAAGIGTLGACLIAPTTYLDPGFMNKVLIYSFAAATLGGLDSVRGAIAGGVLTGLAASLLTGYLPIGSELGLIVAFAVIVVILQFRPNGLFGTRTQERV